MDKLSKSPNNLKKFSKIFLEFYKLLDNNTIGSRLKAAREHLSLTPSQFAKKAGVDISQYSKAEKGVEGLGPKKINKLVEAHGINADFLATGKGEILQNGEILASKPAQNTDHFTAGQLFHMYMKAMERQDKIMKAQTTILNRIEKEMARESTLANVETNLESTLLGVRSLELKISSGGLKVIHAIIAAISFCDLITSVMRKRRYATAIGPAHPV